MVTIYQRNRNTTVQKKSYIFQSEFEHFLTNGTIWHPFELLSLLYVQNIHYEQMEFKQKKKPNGNLSHALLWLQIVRCSSCMTSKLNGNNSLITSIKAILMLLVGFESKKNCARNYLIHRCTFFQPSKWMLFQSLHCIYFVISACNSQ